MALQAKRAYDVKTLMASTVVTATSTGTDPVALPGMVNAFAFVLDVTNAATDSGDKLDVYVQTMLDGTNYVDVIRFTQVLGNGSNTLRFIAKIAAGLAESEFENGTGLAAAASRDLLGDLWRVRYVVTDAGTDDATFTFSVTAIPM